MELEDFKDKHKGEEFIVIGNGPGLKNIPLAFLESRLNFAINFLPDWLEFIRYDYWIALDSQCYEMVRHEALKGVQKFVHGRHRDLCESEGYLENGDVLPFGIPQKIHGLGFGGDPPFARYSTSLIGAAHLATYMGASKIFIVGFDCTFNMYAVKKSRGRTGLPHVYDRESSEVKGITQNSWCAQFGRFAEWALEGGTEIINLSIPTTCDSVPLGDYRDYWQPPEQLQEGIQAGF